MIPILNRINSIPRIDTYFFKIHYNLRFLRLGLPEGLFHVAIKILRALLPSSILATWPAHLDLLDLITLTILGERYKLWTSSLWSLLQSHLLLAQMFCLDRNLKLSFQFYLPACYSLYYSSGARDPGQKFTRIWFLLLAYGTAIFSISPSAGELHCLGS